MTSTGHVLNSQTNGIIVSRRLCRGKPIIVGRIKFCLTISATIIGRSTIGIRVRIRVHKSLVPDYLFSAGGRFRRRCTSEGFNPREGFGDTILVVAFTPGRWEGGDTSVDVREEFVGRRLWVSNHACETRHATVSMLLMHLRAGVLV